MSQEELIKASHFLLDHPPLEEIGGKITGIIEDYRYKLLTKQQAEQQMLREYHPFLSKFIKEMDSIPV